jgi:Delta3-Delta2-enoyl-CoA isomerase
MALIDYTIEDNVAVLSMNSGENRFNFPFIDAFFEVLDKIERDTDANVLVTKSSHDKIWSTAIDPDSEKEDTKLTKKFRAQMYSLYRRVLTYPMITVAAITGHAFAAGAYLAFSHDFRFMRKDRGWLCLPEVDLGINLGLVLTAIARRAVPDYKLEEMLYTGKRLTAVECAEHHIIHKACHMDDLMNEVLSFAKAQNKDRSIIRLMKRETHQQLLKIIDNTILFLDS